MKPHRERAYLWTLLLFIFGYASYLLSKFIFVVCSLPVLLLLTPFPNAKRVFLQTVIHKFLAFFSRTWLPGLGVYRIAEISGLEQALASLPAVFVANHRGYMDAILMLGFIPRIGVLIKTRYARQPMYHMLVRHFDLVSVDRYSLESLSDSLDRCLGIIRRGTNLLIFPEGTRARSGRLQPFNRFAFDLAAAAAMPVIPVVIHSTQPFMAKVPGSIFPRGRNVYRIRFLEAEGPGTGEESGALSDRVRRRVAQELKRLDEGTPWEVPSADQEPGRRPGPPSVPRQARDGGAREIEGRDSRLHRGGVR